MAEKSEIRSRSVERLVGIGVESISFVRMKLDWSGVCFSKIKFLRLNQNPICEE